MAQSIPKHLLEKLARLYYTTNGQKFTQKEAQKILNISCSYAGQVLPVLVRAGWLYSKRMELDRRKKEYTFCELCSVIREIGKNLEKK